MKNLLTYLSVVAAVASDKMLTIPYNNVLYSMKIKAFA